MSVTDELISRSVKRRTTAVEEEQLRIWRQASVENERYYHELSLLLRTAAALGSADVSNSRPAAIDLVDLADSDSAVMTGVVRPKAARGWLRNLAVAAVLGTVAIGGAWYYEHFPRSSFQLGAGEFVTGPSETGIVALSDGTVVRMAPRSRLRVLATAGRRDVFLSGKAYFSVARMEEYPFRVRSAGGDVTALGTRFEVKAEEDVRVVVAEGRVALQGVTGKVEVGAGEMSILMEDTPSAPVKVDVAPILAWVGSFIAFQSTPLHRAAVELEREYDAKVIIADTDLTDMTITGWYVDRTFEEVITIVCGVLGAPCSVQNGTATIGNPTTSRR